MATKEPSSSGESAELQSKSTPKLTLELLAANQREINGSLYEALDLILDYIGAAPGSGDRAKLQRAQAIVDAIPGFDPPGCGSGPYP